MLTLEGINSKADQAMSIVWYAPTLLEGCTDYGAGYQTSRYGKFSRNLVILQGLINIPATIVDGETIFVLPVGFRPASRLMFTVMSYIGSYTAIRIDVLANGNVILTSNSGGAGYFLSFNGIFFIAEQ